MSSSQKDRALARAKIFFVETANKEASLATKHYKDWVDTAIANGEVTIEDFEMDKVNLAQMEEHIADHMERELAAAWAKYVSQASLKTQGSKGKEVSNMDNYFGEDPSKQNKFEGKPDRSGTSGVFRVEVEILENDPTDAGEPHKINVKTDVTDMNDEVKRAIIERAGGKLENVDLPKEIHARLRWVGPTGTARLAVDERNNIRHVRNWDKVSFQGLAPRFYHDPAKLYAYLQSLTLKPD